MKICRDAFSPSLKVIYDIPKPRIEEKPHHLLLVAYLHDKAAARVKAVDFLLLNLIIAVFPFGRYPETL